VGEGSQQVDLLWWCEDGEFRVDRREVDVKPFAPSFPKAPAYRVSRLHDASGDGVGRSSEKTLDAVLVAKRYKVQ